ncbi:putative tpr domain-containing protein [Daldinia childiae]|uniref:putative tpr domain-containing protein n=1 Tax=Daldinia childiae TaxID=326645 RepID=UPI0014452317|nr:putative tpr domain-containing protein [Daldinia childiae]KAF3058432.1 putative tpr domain-containing protein [Daldinia childiae]
MTPRPKTDTKPENLWGKRTRILGKLVGISVKLENFIPTNMSSKRRQVEGVKEGEGDWMTPEQIGGALEALGNHYESKSQHYLSAPLFLQAVSLSPRNSCHTAVLMNNLAISLAQQPINTPTNTNPTSQGSRSNVAARPTRSTLLASARAWALQAQETAQKVQGEDRTDECDEACAVALCNLGDIAAMTGDTEEARRKFKESLSLSKRIAFDPGVAQAQEGLQRLSTVTKQIYYNFTFQGMYPSSENTDGSGETTQPDSQQPPSKPAAKRKRENRYKNAPPSVLSSYPLQRRRAQNRASQRAYRERKDQRIKDLEILLGEAQKKNDVLSLAYSNLQTEYLRLKRERERDQEAAARYTQTALIYDPTIDATSTDMDLFLYGGPSGYSL